jgi:hypothetical protein
MRGSLTKLGYVALLAGAVLVGSIFHAYGSSTPTIFNACLTTGGTLINVSTQGAVSCPQGSSPVSWNQQGAAAGGLSQIVEITASQTFVVPAGITHLGVEAWGGGGGGSQYVEFPDCISSAAGGSGGYLRVIISVTPGESLAINVGSAGGPGVDGGSSKVMSGGTIVVSAGGGGAGTVVTSPSPATIGGAGGQVVSPGGIVRTGNPGGSGTFDMMCAYGPGNPPSSPAGTPGAAIQGSVGLLNNDSAGGQGAIGFVNAGQPGGAGDVILSW